jgi:hypothetical protein
MRALAHSPAHFEYSPLATIHLSPRAPARRGPQSPVRARDLEIREGAPALSDFEACRERAGSVPGACRERAGSTWKLRSIRARSPLPGRDLSVADRLARQ